MRRNSKENKTIIKALEMYGRVPESWELLNENEILNNKIKELERFNFNIVEKYLKEIHSIIDKYDEDSELLHIKLDDLLLNFIDELGYHQIVASYLAIKNKFWYA